MNKTEIARKVNQIISGYLKIPIRNLRDDISVDEESAWDSVTHLKMLSEIERVFKIKLSIDEMIELENVGKIKEIVIKKLGDKIE